MHVSSLQIQKGEEVHRGQACLAAPRALLCGHGQLYFQGYHRHCLHTPLALSVRDAWRHSSISKNLQRAVSAPGNGCVLTPSGNTWRSGSISLCHSISALLMVHKATHL